jgi:hypothetical protein
MPAKKATKRTMSLKKGKKLEETKPLSIIKATSSTEQKLFKNLSTGTHYTTGTIL